jgi:hypothetical protein
MGKFSGPSKMWGKYTDTNVSMNGDLFFIRIYKKCSVPFPIISCHIHTFLLHIAHNDGKNRFSQPIRFYSRLRGFHTVSWSYGFFHFSRNTTAVCNVKMNLYVNFLAGQLQQTVHELYENIPMP